jgi:hypothetical protein
MEQYWSAILTRVTGEKQKSRVSQFSSKNKPYHIKDGIGVNVNTALGQFSQLALKANARTLK